MRTNRTRIALLAALIAMAVAPQGAVLAQDVRPFTLGELEELLEAGYTHAQVYDVARRSCIGFLVDEAAGERLRAMGFAQEYVGAFRGICFDPRRSAGADPRVDDPRADAAARPQGPEIQILEPREWALAAGRGITVAPKRSITVRGTVRHPSGITDVMIDGARAALTLEGSGISGTFSGFVPVTAETRQVEIAAWSGDGRVSMRTFTVQPSMQAAPNDAAAAASDEGALASFGGRRWAVVIGISDYRDPAIPDLEYADDDARAVYGFLRSEAAGLGGIPTQNIRLLVNEQATARNIRSALFTFLNNSTEDDVLVIYIAGHGVPDPDRPGDFYLLGHDAELRDLAATAVPMADVGEAVQRAYAYNKVLITDACHSANMGTAGRRAGNINAINQLFLDAMSSASGGYVAFTASETNQLSQEGMEWGGGHGVFTHYLLEGLRGGADADGDRIITLGEMMEFTRERVRRETANAQIPAISLTSYDRYWPMAIALQP